MIVRPYSETDHATLERWWLEHDAAPVPHAMLPTDGCIVEQDGVMCAAGWLYTAGNSIVSFLAWPVVNPNITGRSKYEAMNHVIMYLSQLSDVLQHGVVLGMSAAPSVTRLLEANGFMVGTGNTDILFRK